MVSHDCVAFYLLAEEVSSHVKVVQSGQGADEVFAGYHWYPPMAADAAGVDGAVAATRKTFFDRDHDGRPARCVAGDRRSTATLAGQFVAEHFARPGRRPRVDRGAAARHHGHARRRPGQAGRQHDDGVGAGGAGCRSSTTSSSNSPPPARRSSSPRTAARACSRRLPAGSSRHEVIDRPKGYFPVPALDPSRGPVPRAGARRAVRAAGPERGLFRPEASTPARRPERRLTPLRGNELWQIGLLELWLQRTASPDPPHERHHEASPRRSPSAFTTRRRSTSSTRWPRTRPRPRLGPADLRADLRRSRRSSRRCCAGRATGRRDICIYARESACRRRPVTARVVHRPQPHLPVASPADRIRASPSGFTVRLA